VLCYTHLLGAQIDLAQTTTEGSTALKLQEDKLEATVRELAVKVSITLGNTSLSLCYDVQSMFSYRNATGSRCISRAVTV
jgi:hypothetical protein